MAVGSNSKLLRDGMKNQIVSSRHLHFVERLNVILLIGGCLCVDL